MPIPDNFIPITESEVFSIDGTLAGNSDEKIVSEKAIKTYADTKKTEAINTLRNGVPAEGDDLNKLYNLITAINAIIGGTAPDGDSIVDTVAELLAVFAAYPEGVDIVLALADKINVSVIVNTLTEVNAGKVLDARQGKALKDLIDALTASKADDNAVVKLTGNQTIAGQKTFNGKTIFGAATAAVAIALVDGATINVDAALGDLFTVTLGGNRTLANPTNPTNKQIMIFEIKQDATGNRTLALGNKFVFGSDVTALNLSTAANKTDFITVQYDEASDKFRVLSVSRGY